MNHRADRVYELVLPKEEGLALAQLHLVQIFGTRWDEVLQVNDSPQDDLVHDRCSRSSKTRSLLPSEKSTWSRTPGLGQKGARRIRPLAPSMLDSGPLGGEINGSHNVWYVN